MVMIDWVTAKIPFYYPGIISDGQMISVTRDGEVDYSVHKRLQLRGSFDGSITIRTDQVDADGNTCIAELSGNPVKFLQGHNIFGSDDLPNLVYETVERIVSILEIPQPKHFTNMILCGAYTVSRVDVNRMYTLNSRAEANAYIYAMSQQCKTKSGAALLHKGTCYLNKDSRRWALKAYAKAQETELKRHNKQGCIDLPQELKKWVDPTLRIEATLKSNELRERGLHVAHNWFTMDTIEIHSDYVGRVEMYAQKPIDTAVLKDIKPRAAVSTYLHWKNGLDVTDPALIATRTFYRHRKALLEHGVDISMPPPKEDQVPASNVVPLIKTIELKPAVIPDWVSGTEYLFEPRKLCNANVPAEIDLAHARKLGLVASA